MARLKLLTRTSWQRNGTGRECSLPSSHRSSDVWTPLWLHSTRIEDSAPCPAAPRVRSLQRIPRARPSVVVDSAACTALVPPSSSSSPRTAPGSAQTAEMLLTGRLAGWLALGLCGSETHTRSWTHAHKRTTVLPPYAQFLGPAAASSPGAKRANRSKSIGRLTELGEIKLASLAFRSSGNNWPLAAAVAVAVGCMTWYDYYSTTLLATLDCCCCCWCSIQARVFTHKHTESRGRGFDRRESDFGETTQRALF